MAAGRPSTGAGARRGNINEIVACLGALFRDAVKLEETQPRHENGERCAFEWVGGSELPDNKCRLSGTGR